MNPAGSTLFPFSPVPDNKGAGAGARPADASASGGGAGESGRAGGGPVSCRHCGQPLLDPRSAKTGFCCAGCARVFRLIHDQGLGSYYSLKDGITPPPEGAAFGSRDYGWLAALQRAAEEAGPAFPTATIALGIQGVSCAGCVWLIERIFRKQPGARECRIAAQLGSMNLRWTRGECDLPAFARALQDLGYQVGPPGEAGSSGDSESRALAKRIGLCAAFAMNVMLFTLPTYFGMSPDFEYARLFSTLSFVFGTLSLLAGGGYFLGRAVRAAAARVPHIDLPIGLGILGAYAGSTYGWISGHERFVYFDFVSGFILLMLVGRWAQVAAVERNRRRLLQHGARPAPVRLPDGTELPAEEVRSGLRFSVAPGRSVPVDARLVGQGAVVSLASINGEADPRTFAPGQSVPGGAVNLTRSEIVFEAVQDWKDSLVARLLRVTAREPAKNPLLERIVAGYLVAILVLAAAAGAAWWWTTGDALQAGAVVTSVLVVSCPCAIGLAFPLAEEMATVALRRIGLYVREADLWSRLSRVRFVVFDKTGTLTFENPRLENPEALDVLDRGSRQALFALVRENPHPHAQSICEHLLARGEIEPLPGTPEETVGFGVERDGWTLGRAGWRDEDPFAGGTVFAWHGQTLARFHFTHAPRDNARDEIAALRRLGYSVFILSGDRGESVCSFAEKIGVPASHALGDLSPDDKAAWIEAQGAGSVLMLGDGANVGSPGTELEFAL